VSHHSQHTCTVRSQLTTSLSQLLSLQFPLIISIHLLPSIASLFVKWKSFISNLVQPQFIILSYKHTITFYFFAPLLLCLLFLTVTLQDSLYLNFTPPHIYLIIVVSARSFTVFTNHFREMYNCIPTHYKPLYNNKEHLWQWGRGQWPELEPTTASPGASASQSTDNMSQDNRTRPVFLHYAVFQKKTLLQPGWCHLLLGQTLSSFTNFWQTYFWRMLA